MKPVRDNLLTKGCSLMKEWSRHAEVNQLMVACAASIRMREGIQAKIEDVF